MSELTRRFRTRYVGPEGTRGGRIRITDATDRRQYTMPYPHDAHDPHAAAIARLIGHPVGLFVHASGSDDGTRRAYTLTIPTAGEGN